MKTHKNARLTLARRVELASSVVEAGIGLRAAALAHGVSETTARKWVRRFVAEGACGLADRSSRPLRIPRRSRNDQIARVIELRRLSLPMAEIGREVGVSVSTVSRICATSGLDRFDLRAWPRRAAELGQTPMVNNVRPTLPLIR